MQASVVLSRSRSGRFPRHRLPLSAHRHDPGEVGMGCTAPGHSPRQVVSVNDDVVMSDRHAHSMRTIPDCTPDRTRTLLPLGAPFLVRSITGCVRGTGRRCAAPGSCRARCCSGASGAGQALMSMALTRTGRMSTLTRDWPGRSRSRRFASYFAPTLLAKE